MKRRYLFFLPVCLALPILLGGAFLFSMQPAALAQHGNILGTTSVNTQTTTGSAQEESHYQIALFALDALDSAQQASSNQINTQQCYHDPQLQVVRSKSVSAGDGVMSFALDYCPGQFGLQETGQPLTHDSCALIQNDLTAQGGQGGFAGECSPQLNTGNFQTAPSPNDGYAWQACWIDYATALPKPVCTDLRAV